MVKIKEIFKSIQGEGPFVGYKQLFIRLCGCNLSCKFCDTDFDINKSKEYSINELKEIITNSNDCHSVSLTGGEPLLHTDFIKEFAKICQLPMYLETNGTLHNELKKVIDNVEYISSDIKIPSCTGLSPMWEEHDRFFNIAKTKTLFAKMVFDSNITEEEIKNSCMLCSKYDIELVLQPMMEKNIPAITSQKMEEVLNSCLKEYKKVRLIPQVHKFIDVI